MTDILALVGTIVAIIAGLAQIFDTKNRKALTIAVGLGLIFLALIFAANFFYFGPKSKGEHFLVGLRNLNAVAMQADVCEDSPLYTQFSGIGGILINVASPFASNRISNITYNPISKQFQFFYSLTSSLTNQDETRFATIQIKTVGLNEFCVSDLGGLDTTNGTSSSSLNNAPNSSFTSPNTTTSDSASMAIYVKNVLMGEQAYNKVQIHNSYLQKREGWQIVSFVLVLENTTKNLIQSSQTSGSSWRLSGKLYDTGGFEREMNLVDQSTPVALHPAIFLPGVRYTVDIWSEIPVNQTLSSFNLSLEGLFNNQVIKFSQVRDDLVVPFETVPNLAPAIQNDTVSYTRPNEFRMVLSNFRFDPNPFWKNEGYVTLDADAEVENLGGFDLNSIQNGINMLGVDDRGNYIRTLDVGVGEAVPPGVTKKSNDVLLLTLKKPHQDFEWIWLIAFDGQMTPISQVQLFPKS